MQSMLRTFEVKFQPPGETEEAEEAEEEAKQNTKKENAHKM